MHSNSILRQRVSASPFQHDPAAPAQQVIIQGRILLERTAFVGHGFGDEDVDVVEFFKNLLSELSVKVITGERAEANSVSQKVKDRIAQGELFVGILTRREMIDEKTWRASDWVLEEKTHAAAIGKKVILLKESGVVLTGGLQGDFEYIEFDRQKLHQASIKLIQMIWSINPGKVALNKSGPTHISLDILEAAITAQPREPMLRVQLAQARSGNGQTDAALRALQDALQLFPNFGPARLELSKQLRNAGRLEESEKEVRQLIEQNAFDANAHHELGHLFEQKNKILDAFASFKTAEDCAPGDFHHFMCHGRLLYRTAGDNRDRLIESRDMLKIAIELGGPNVEKQEKGFLSGVERRIKQLPPNRTIDKRAKKRKR